MDSSQLIANMFSEMRSMRDESADARATKALEVAGGNIAQNLAVWKRAVGPGFVMVTYDTDPTKTAPGYVSYQKIREANFDYGVPSHVIRAAIDRSGPNELVQVVYEKSSGQAVCRITPITSIRSRGSLAQYFEED
jgi:hypothetical protein